MPSRPSVRRWLLVPALLGLLLSPSRAEEPVVPPTGGEPLIPQPVEATLGLPHQPGIGESRRVTVDGPGFTMAVEMKCVQAPENPWNFQTSALVPSPIHKGDVIWIGGWMRAVQTGNESGEAISELSLEQNATPFDKFTDFDLSAGPEWRQFAIAFVAEFDGDAGKTQVCLRGGYMGQTIQIGGLSLLDYGTSVKVSDLPRTKVGYAGMEPDAPWRKAAAERIERIRKADLRIEVKDAAGRAAPGAKVTIEEVRAGFGFGSCVSAKAIVSEGGDYERERQIIEHDYSKVVLANDLKWTEWENPQRQPDTLAAIHWLRDRGIEVRGHNLVWPSWHSRYYLPKDLAALKDQPDALRKRIDDHIREEVTATRGLLSEWDVVNEPYANHDIQDVLGEKEMVDWFKIAHQADPKPVLFLNDYAGLVSAGLNTAHKDSFEKTLHMLKDNGAPIGGLGIQAHFGRLLTPPEKLYAELDRWAALGLEIEITEFDLDFGDEELQGRYLRDFMTMVFSHPAVSAILMWGFWEGDHWKPAAALYRKDWSIKPNGEAWNDLVLKQWRSNLTAETDAGGGVANRVFLGDYKITVDWQGKRKSWPLTVGSGGAVLAAGLDP